MTLCNMAVECCARGALMAPDDKVVDYLQGNPRAPQGALWDAAVTAWSALKSDPDAVFDAEETLVAEAIAPMVSWGTSPERAIRIDQNVPDTAQEPDAARRHDMERALQYMGLSAGQPAASIAIQKAFIGSCTNARIEDLRDAAHVLAGRKVAPGVTAVIVPGYSSVRRQAEAEGLDQVVLPAGFEWRQSGCSMCLAMNDDILASGERCASSTNRNFEDLQGAGARTHLMSPAMVAAAAVADHLADVRHYMQGAQHTGRRRWHGGVPHQRHIRPDPQVVRKPR